MQKARRRPDTLPARTARERHPRPRDMPCSRRSSGDHEHSSQVLGRDDGGGAAAERPHRPLWRQEARAPGGGRPAVHTPGGALEGAPRRSCHSPRRRAPQQQASGLHQAQAAPGPPRRRAATTPVEHRAHHEQSVQGAQQDSAPARRSAVTKAHDLQQIGVPRVPESVDKHRPGDDTQGTGMHTDPGQLAQPAPGDHPAEPPGARHGRLGQGRPGRLGPHGSAHHAGEPEGGHDNGLLPRER